MTSATSWIGIGTLVLFLCLMSGIWAGLWGLWKARRGAAWWLMCIGTAFGTLGPILYSGGTWMLMNSFRDVGTSSPSVALGGSMALPILLMAGGLMIPAGMLLFTIGFAIHGLAASRVAARAEELETLAAAMTEEINRLRNGGSVA
jgi:hypothetical protein